MTTKKAHLVSLSRPLRPRVWEENQAEGQSVASALYTGAGSALKRSALPQLESEVPSLEG